MINRKILVIDEQKDAGRDLAEIIVSSCKPRADKSRLKQPETYMPEIDQPEGDDTEITYDVETAKNGEDGYKKVRSAVENDHPYNLIFLDMQMSYGDSMKTMEAIFEIDKKVQMILCTTAVNSSWEEIFAKTGCRDNILILKKPFDDIEAAQLALTLTEKYIAEAHLRHSQKMETIGALSAGLAHDFNNIISSLQATLSSLQFSLDKHKNHSPLKKEIQTDIDTMAEAIKQGGEMVHILLSLSRKQELPLAPVDLNELIRKVLKICMRTLDKSIHINFSPSLNKAFVMVYPIQIEQVILNLCINAAHAMTIMRPENTKRGGHLTIETEDVTIDHLKRGNIMEIPKGSYRRLSIKDTGVGIPSDTMSQIFEPFFTTKKREKGSGLGLAMTFNIIKKHKGFLDVESIAGKGSSFNIYLPAINPHIS